MHRTLPLLGLVVLLASAFPGRGLAVARMIPPAPYRAKDFTLARMNGVYHLFYILHDTTLAFGQTEKAFGHAVSGDLRQWTQLQPVLPVRAGQWDNGQVWAPSVLQSGGKWRMFYTGVTENAVDHNFQRIGVAQSSDLSGWIRPDPPVFSCAQTPWTYCDSTRAAGGNLRDPFVMTDPLAPGGWILYYVAMRDTVTSQMLVGAATSTGDLTQWHDMGPLLNTDYPITHARIIESPHVFQHNALWYLFYTTGSAHPIAFQTSDQPLAAATGWSAQLTLAAEVPNTDHLFASEMVHDGGRDLFMAANDSTNGIDIWEVAWDTPPHFHFVDPPGAPSAGVDAASAGALALAVLGPAVSPAPLLRLVLPAPMPARLELFDLAGRRVRRLLDQPLGAGARAVAWDGRDDAGASLPAGVYLARLEAASGTRRARVTLVR